nr:RNA-directed DNA polymerase, eukaryota [Tanacetum cinerariifolium]
MEDRWRWDLNGDGYFHVKDVRSKLDDSLLPKADTPTRWIKTIPIKLIIFAWKVSLNRLPTRLNLVWRGVLVSPISCPVCLAGLEDLDHLLFRCNMAAEGLYIDICIDYHYQWTGNTLHDYITILKYISDEAMIVIEGKRDQEYNESQMDNRSIDTRLANHPTPHCVGAYSEMFSIQHCIGFKLS